MSVNWLNLFFSVVVIGLIIAFFVGLFLFIAKSVHHYRSSKIDRDSIERKLDYIIRELDQRKIDAESKPPV